MKWLQRLQVLEESQEPPGDALTKLTKAPSVSSVSAPSRVSQDFDAHLGDGSGAENEAQDEACQDQATRDSTTGDIGRTAVPEPGPGADGLVWRGWFAERAAIREFDAGYPRPMAERLSYNEAVYRWHRLFGTRPDPACCAGCDLPVSGREVLQLPGGARVHVDGDYVCLIEYGRRWRSSAVEALAAHGLTPPERWRP